MNTLKFKDSLKSFSAFRISKIAGVYHHKNELRVVVLFDCGFVVEHTFDTLEDAGRSYAWLSDKINQLNTEDFDFKPIQS